jgi:hypothetical protein
MEPFCNVVRISYVEAKMTVQKRKIHWLLWPFWALWKLISGIVEFTGRIVAVVLGLVLMIVGVIVSLTIVGAIIGIPLAIVGLLLTLRGLF